MSFCCNVKNNIKYLCFFFDKLIVCVDDLRGVFLFIVEVIQMDNMVVIGSPYI